MKVRHLAPVLNVSVEPGIVRSARVGAHGFVWTDEGGMGGAEAPDFGLNPGRPRGRDLPSASTRRQDAPAGVVSWFSAEPRKSSTCRGACGRARLRDQCSRRRTSRRGVCERFHLRHPNGHTLRVGAEVGSSRSSSRARAERASARRASREVQWVGASPAPSRLLRSTHSKSWADRRGLVDFFLNITELSIARPHHRRREILRHEIVQLVPAKGRGDGRIRTRAHRYADG